MHVNGCIESLKIIPESESNQSVNLFTVSFLVCFENFNLQRVNLCKSIHQNLKFLKMIMARYI